ncbi:MAG: 2-phosphosulfolactate phosphatase [Polyangiales bacterium]
MEILRLRPADLPVPLVDIAVVMDVFRMTSTAAALMRRTACTRASVAATLDDLEHLPAGERVLISELPEAEHRGTRIDNSPAQASRVDLTGRMPVLVTTNGTRVLLAAAACAQRVLLGCFGDVHALARYVISMRPARVLLLPAGHIASGRGCIEDDLCADVFEALVLGRAVDVAAALTDIRADSRVIQRCEAEAGFEADVDLALRCDDESEPLEFLAINTSVGHIVAAQRTQ